MRPVRLSLAERRVLLRTARRERGFFYVESAAVIFLMVVGSLINPPNTSSYIRKRCLPKTTLALFLSSVSKKPSLLPSTSSPKTKITLLTKMTTTTTTTPKSFFCTFFTRFCFQIISFFLRFSSVGCSDSFVSLSLSLSLSRFVLASPFHSLVQNSFCALLKRRRPQRKSDAVRRWGGGAFRFPSLFLSLRARALPPVSSSFH